MAVTCIQHLAVAAFLCGLFGVSQASATVMQQTSTEANCNTPSGTAQNCTDTVLFSNTVATDTTSFISGSVGGQNPSSADFITAFNNWDQANGGPYTLVNGGVLDLSLSASIGGTLGQNGGGLDHVIVNLAGYVPAVGGPTLSQLIWTQALFTDYAPTVGLEKMPVVTLDTYSLSAGSPSSGGAFGSACVPIPGPPNADNNTTPSTIGATPSGKAYCDPIYPFQYGTNFNGQTLDRTTLSTDFFYDAPQGPFPNASFRGITLLSTVTDDTDSMGDIVNRILTVYQGVDYGFDLGINGATDPVETVSELAVVPEPGIMWMVVCGVAATVGCRHRSRRNR